MTFWKLDLFPSSGEEGEKTPTQLGPSEGANLNHWTWAFGLFLLCGVPGSRNTMFWKLNLFPSSGEGREKTPTHLSALEK
jgi:hypothetical protein